MSVEKGATRVPGSFHDIIINVNINMNFNLNLYEPILYPHGKDSWRCEHNIRSNDRPAEGQGVQGNQRGEAQPYRCRQRTFEADQKALEKGMISKLEV